MNASVHIIYMSTHFYYGKVQLYKTLNLRAMKYSQFHSYRAAS